MDHRARPRRLLVTKTITVDQDQLRSSLMGMQVRSTPDQTTKLFQPQDINTVKLIKQILTNDPEAVK